MVVPVGGDHGKIGPLQLAAALEASTSAGAAAYQPSAAVVSVTQPTEAGTLYTLADASWARSARSRTGTASPCHMDGARLANAVAALGCTAAETTSQGRWAWTRSP